MTSSPHTSCDGDWAISLFMFQSCVPRRKNANWPFIHPFPIPSACAQCTSGNWRLEKVGEMFYLCCCGSPHSKCCTLGESAGCRRATEKEKKLTVCFTVTANSAHQTHKPVAARCLNCCISILNCNHAKFGSKKLREPTFPLSASRIRKWRSSIQVAGGTLMP